ncbi:hypothetical protein LCGC14_2211690 [marine sediment metagenome]|uniref:Uncharacterized protein n=1 Tax=marine sediment metagenome TaxID=412755 RepID=A0A0F9FR51_9ZZZZ
MKINARFVVKGGHVIFAEAEQINVVDAIADIKKVMEEFPIDKGLFREVKPDPNFTPTIVNY